MWTGYPPSTPPADRRTHTIRRNPWPHLRATTAQDAGKTVPEILALAFGAVYLLVGIVGFFVTGFDNFAGNEQHEMLLGLFMINPLHNIAHILVGVVGLVLARTLAGARTYGWLLAGLYAALFVYGLIAVGEDWDFLNVNAGDNVLHIAHRRRRPGDRAAAGPHRGRHRRRTPDRPLARSRAGFRRPARDGGTRLSRLPPQAAREHTRRRRPTTADQPRPRTPRGARWTTIRSCAR